MVDSHDSIRVDLFVESRYPLNRKRIKKTALEILKAHGVQGPAVVSIAIIGDRKMKILNKKYRGVDKTTNVLSFSLVEGKASSMPSDVLYLGDVVISYPQVIDEAAAQDMLVDDRIAMLVEHGLQHLMGTHH